MEKYFKEALLQGTEGVSLKRQTSLKTKSSQSCFGGNTGPGGYKSSPIRKKDQKTVFQSVLGRGERTVVKKYERTRTILSKKAQTRMNKYII